MLSLQCVDSRMTKSFLRLPDGKKVSKSCLQANISRITAATWLKNNDHIVQYEADKCYEKGRTIRMDATTIEANIHPPSDWSTTHGQKIVASADGGFASRKNVEKAKNQGVKDVCFRAAWKGMEGFKAYVQSSVVAYNLTVLCLHTFPSRSAGLHFIFL